jgi:hypothetical protein
VNLFVPVVTVSVYNRVDHAFSHGHAYTVLLILIEARIPGRAKDLSLGFIHAVERGWVLSIKQNFGAGSHSFSVSALSIRRRAFSPAHAPKAPC